MSALRRLVLAIALAGGCAGCATPPASAPSLMVISQQAKTVGAERAKHAVVVGRSTKADVAAALGETLAILFDSGYEIWLYRLTDDASQGENVGQRLTRLFSQRRDRESTAEYVILFSPEGVVAKTRIRPPPRG